MIRHDSPCAEVHEYVAANYGSFATLAIDLCSA